VTAVDDEDGYEDEYDDGGGDEVVAVPGYATGGRVERTGIALVHQGEYIVPDTGSEAVVTPWNGAGPVVHYYFPVQVEVVGTLPDAEVERVAGYVFAELDRELATRA
jgi:hypothetical protein